MPVPARARDWLALCLAPGIGARRAARLNEGLGGPLAWVGASDKALADCGLPATAMRALRHPDNTQIDACLDWLKPGHHWLVTLDDELYPPLLRQIDDPPPCLFLAGDPGLLVRPQVAIVGSRGATRGGLDHAADFAATLARAGFTVTSGLAAGIDARAHEGCLGAGGPTIAVIGTGPDIIYPARNKPLALEIVKQGAIVSPFPPGTQPRPGNFPARNRLISGMSLGTLVVEASLRSGSLITARLASEQGREVFAIPGSTHNPQARGCHALIKQGARLVEGAEEIVEALAPLAEELAGSLKALLDLDQPADLDKSETVPHMEEDADYRALLDAIGYDPTPIDQIIGRSELTTAQVSSMLLIMELDGRITAHPGGRYSRSA